MISASSPPFAASDSTPQNRLFRLRVHPLRAGLWISLLGTLRPGAAQSGTAAPTCLVGQAHNAGVGRKHLRQIGRLQRWALVDGVGHLLRQLLAIAAAGVVFARAGAAKIQDLAGVARKLGLAHVAEIVAERIAGVSDRRPRPATGALRAMPAGA